MLYGLEVPVLALLVTLFAGCMTEERFVEGYSEASCDHSIRCGTFDGSMEECLSYVAENREEWACPDFDAEAANACLDEYRAAYASCGGGEPEDDDASACWDVCSND